MDPGWFHWRHTDLDGLQPKLANTWQILAEKAWCLRDAEFSDPGVGGASNSATFSIIELQKGLPFGTDISKVGLLKI